MVVTPDHPGIRNIVKERVMISKRNGYKDKECVVHLCTEILKDFQANVGMAGWRHWLTKYIDKDSTFYNIATFPTSITPYISSSEY